MRSIELRQKILLIRLAGQLLLLNGNQTKERVFLSKLLRIILSGIRLGELYQWFTDTYAQLSLQELKDRLNENINSIYAMIDSLSDEELFKPHMRKMG